MSKILSVATAMILGGALFVAPAYAEVIDMTAELSGAQEVPPIEVPATGMVEASFDTETMELTYTATYEGLSGDATAAHFHGPAPEGENTSPVLPIEGELASPIEGTATLTEEQAADLQAGLWYFNVHTEANGGGEIRGQVTAAEAM